jgi:enoyl-CoA hydratase/carnithine racemase
MRAVILHGAGEKAFAAGADIKAFLELTGCCSNLSFEKLRLLNFVKSNVDEIQ